ncbi:MAG: hypothetical protein KGJ03_16510 [Betaproteobacteria bacterium]|nr:hypothetical protein [Betaproteobacteria bacterium]MBU6512929.1 hypothetical protein [Betaproteobacteria bacterium]MDE1957315.1 hypothetical protein [Betaproteobacteria bacterium]MDE2153102.1 hypothetical protein [Betaproteobacteria bacterium]
MKLLRLLLCAAALLAGVATAQAAPAAVPSIHDVYTAASTGHVAQARREIDQVLAAYPGSAKAHYVSARVAALQGDWPMASRELGKAQSLDPGLGFERRDTLQAFTQQVAAHAGRAAPARRGFPMGALGIALVVLALIVLWAVYRASRRPPVQMMAPGWPGTPGAPGQAPYPPGYPPQPMGQAPYGAYPPGAQGSGILGAVGTGLAVGAGMAAGQMVVDKLFDRGGSVLPDAQAAPPMADPGAALPNDQDFGISDPGSWTDDSSSGSWGDDSSGSDNWS